MTDLLALLRADLRAAWADDPAPVVVLAVLLLVGISLAGWLLLGGYAPS